MLMVLYHIFVTWDNWRCKCARGAGTSLFLSTPLSRLLALIRQWRRPIVTRPWSSRVHTRSIFLAGKQKKRKYFTYFYFSLLLFLNYSIVIHYLIGALPFFYFDNSMKLLRPKSQRRMLVWRNSLPWRGLLRKEKLCSRYTNTYVFVILQCLNWTILRHTFCIHRSWVTKMTVKIREEGELALEPSHQLRPLLHQPRRRRRLRNPLQLVSFNYLFHF